MLQNVVPLKSVFQTGQEMRRLVETYCLDLGPWLSVPFYSFYRFVCSLPYIPDPDNIEMVSRPAYTLNEYYGPRDCDDKAILCACWLHAHGVPVCFLATSTKKDKQLHHVLCMIPGCLVDATYKSHEKCIGKYDYWHKVTNAVLISEWF